MNGRQLASKVTYPQEERGNSRDSREHPLIDSKEKVGDALTPDRWSSMQPLETEVVQVTEKLAGSRGECERVTPEEPLERGDTNGHDGDPY